MVAQLWAEAVGTALGSDDDARRELDRFVAALPPGYVEETAPEDAAGDWSAIRSWLASGATGNPPPAAAAGALVLSGCRGGAPGDFRLRRSGPRRIELSSSLPVLESFGLATVESVPWHFVFAQGVEAYVDDIGLRVVTPVTADAGPTAFGPRLVDALNAVWQGNADLTPLNALVVGAGLGWREVGLLCAYCGYRGVVGGPRSADRAAAIANALIAFPTVAAAIVDLFDTLLRQGVGGHTAADERLAAVMLEVPDLAHYEALRELVTLVRATTRSNWALGRDSIALKFAAGEIPFLATPRPHAELFVWTPRYEALHLRFGPVARGGIRWSEREHDLRVEVLGLARAQVKKNSLIIPTGAKGGFALRSIPAGTAENGAEGAGALAERAYRSFMNAMLDITDNVVGGAVVHPAGVVARDGFDPYLVVAPDKGTAALSDLANSISTARGFWLGDAFASGGSHGYDHKALAITARGAWLAVRRHFRALGMDPERDELRVVGVGDMSGDVFGNGVLQSRTLRLVAAFDHRHIFIDPTPDPEKSFAERLRLSRLEASSWADYDLGAASEGAVLVPRQAKRAQLTPAAMAALAVASSEMSPPELVQAVLRAPVDLIFFGGVGTFVRAPGESDVAVDDSANDDVRVSADELRARVVAEGANLAMTQRARGAYARRGGRVNTDFIDNAAGVAMSDREVNMKILLEMAVNAGRAEPGERDVLLEGAKYEAAGAVLATVESSLVALDQAASTSAAELPALAALMAELESTGAVEREVEALPGPEELARRRQAGAGLSRPELAVVLASARSAVARSVDASLLVSSTELAERAARYFPASWRERFADLVPSHPLFAQVIASQLTNELVARMGATWAHEAAAETGRELWEVAAAFWLAAELLGADGVESALQNPQVFGQEPVRAPAPEERGDSVEAFNPGAGVPETRRLPADAEAALRSTFSAASDRLARWYLRSGYDLSPAGLATLLAGDKEVRSVLLAQLERDVASAGRPSGGALGGGAGGGSGGGAAGGSGGGEGGALGAQAGTPPELVALLDAGAPAHLAQAVWQAGGLASVGEVGEVSRASRRTAAEAAGALAAASASLSLPSLRQRISGWPAADRWQRWEAHNLVSDIAGSGVAVAVAALRSYGQLAPGEAVSAWLAQRRGAVARAERLVAELHLSSSPNHALAAVAVRALQDIVGSAPTAGVG